VERRARTDDEPKSTRHETTSTPRARPYSIPLPPVWCSLVNPTIDVVETTAASFSYLFDIGSQRLVAAWGVSAGRHGGKRDASRMAGHPLSAGQRYHRGHAIPHTLGGPTDINLVPQLGSVNVGPFRPLEKKAVATPGSFYFTYWKYRGNSTQIPSGVDQGLFIPGGTSDIRHHGN